MKLHDIQINERDLGSTYEEAQKNAGKLCTSSVEYGIQINCNIKKKNLINIM